MFKSCKQPELELKYDYIILSDFESSQMMADYGEGNTLLTFYDTNSNWSISSYNKIKSS
jgi:hypothetical protein